LALISTVGYIIATTFFPALSLSSFYPKKEIFSAHDKIQKFQKFQKDKNFDFDPFDCCGARKDVRVNGAGICGADRGVCFDVSQIRRQWERMT
jgi:hypothetical protein